MFSIQAQHFNSVEIDEKKKQKKKFHVLVRLLDVHVQFAVEEACFRVQLCSQHFVVNEIDINNSMMWLSYTNRLNTINVTFISSHVNRFAVWILFHLLKWSNQSILKWFGTQELRLNEQLINFTIERESLREQCKRLGKILQHECKWRLSHHSPDACTFYQTHQVMNK